MKADGDATAGGRPRLLQAWAGEDARSRHRVFRAGGTLALTIALAACQSAVQTEEHDDVVLTIAPAAVLLTLPGASSDLNVVAVNGDGETVELGRGEVEWMISDSTTVTVAESRSRPNVATVTALDAVGSASLSARLVGRPATTSEPVLVVVAPVRPGTRLVPDSELVFPFPSLPAAASPESYSPPFVTRSSGVTSVGPFTEIEIAALYAADGDGAFRYPVVLYGDEVPLGTHLLGSESASFFGTAVHVERVDGFNLIQIEQTDVATVFENLIVTFDTESLIDGGVMSAESVPWLEASSIGHAALDVSQCDVTGSIGVASILAGLTIASEPRLAFDINLGSSRFRLLVGRSVRASIGLDVNLQSTLQGSVECPLGPESEVNVAIPGPIGALVSSRGTIQPVAALAIDVAAGPRLSTSAQISLHAHVQVGFDCDENGCTDLSAVEVEPDASATLNWETSPLELLDVELGASVGAYASIKLGLQLGGFVLGTTSRWTRWVPSIGDLLDNVASALFLPFVSGTLGGELRAVWHGPNRVLQAGDTGSEFGLVAYASVAVESAEVNIVRKRFGFQPMQLTLASFETTPLALYRPRTGSVISIGAEQHDGPVAPGATVTVERGESIDVTVTTVLDGQAIPPFAGGLVRGEAWQRVSRELIDTGTLDGPDSIQATLEIGDDLCDLAIDNPLEIALLGYNTMAGTLTTAGYLGDFGILCEEPVATYSGTFRIDAVLECPNLEDVSTLEYVAIGDVTLEIDLNDSTGTAILALTEEFGPTCFTHTSGPLEIHPASVTTTVGDETVSATFAHSDEARSYDLTVDGSIDGPLTGTLQARYFYIGQNGSGSTSITLDKEE